MVAVNRSYNKSDYIPAIAWGRNARFCQKLTVGDNLKIWGRIQSREYQKRYSSGEVVEKVAYEVSVSKMEIAREDDEGGKETPERTESEPTDRQDPSEPME